MTKPRETALKEFSIVLAILSGVLVAAAVIFALTLSDLTIWVSSLAFAALLTAALAHAMRLAVEAVLAGRTDEALTRQE